MSFAVDANILLYASDRGSPLQERAGQFVAECAAGPEICCLPWPAALAYLRIATHPRIFSAPLAPAEAMANIEALIALPHVHLLGEGDGFWEAFRQAADASPPRGNAVPDAQIAALLLEHGVRTLYTHDRDFRRFDFLRVIDPLAVR
jgi:toxin-antitoxin system PIN domain toxin